MKGHLDRLLQWSFERCSLLPTIGIAMVICSSAYASASELPADPVRSGVVMVVGPGQAYESVSDAALKAHSGDTVRILPGTYTDCAVWSQDNLTIEGAGEGVEIADRTCDGKAIFVISGENVTVRHLTLSRAVAPDHNGAGIRAQGGNLTVDHVKFIDNEEGVLAHLREDAALVVQDSFFSGNGNCIYECAHGLYVSRAALLHVEGSEFVAQHVGHHVKSRAATTELFNNVIGDGPQGNASYLIDVPNGGKVLIIGNQLEKGPHAENSTAIAISAEQNQPQNRDLNINIENNHFTNDSASPAVFIRSRSANTAHLSGNVMQGETVPWARFGPDHGGTN